MEDQFDALKSLHTALIDSRNGYDEALEDSEGKGLIPLFREMSVLHAQNAAELGSILRAAGQEADEHGSFMSTMHRAVINIRALFGDLDERILPGLIDGEKRIVSYYDDAIAAARARSDRDVLLSQRATIEKKISDMELRKNMAA